MVDHLKAGDSFLGVVCPNCRGLIRILTMPVDETGQPRETLTLQCPECGKSPQVRRSDIQTWKAHSRQ